MKNKIFSMLMYCLFLIILILGYTNIKRDQTLPLITSEKDTLLLPSLTASVVNEPTKALTQTPVPTSTIVLPPTPFIPTPSDIQTENFLHTIQDGSCQPPCYLGIIPGETRFEDANYKLMNMGARVWIDRQSYENEIMYNYVYKMRHFLPTGFISQTVGVYVYQGYVFRIEVNLNSSKGLLFEDWDKYSISSLLKQFGVPDTVFVSSDNNLNAVWLLYDETGVFIGNTCLAKKANTICPGFQKEDGACSAHMQLFDPKSYELLTVSSQLDSIIVFEFQENGMRFDEVWNQIGTVLGITPAQFYEQMMADPGTCFERINP